MPLNLPARTSIEYLKKLAKDRLEALRASDPSATLADAQRALARDYGFSSWRTLKAEVDRRSEPQAAALARASIDGDLAALRDLLREHPELARARLAAGGTPLHLAVRHPDALRLLVEHGADPNARDDRDGATALHVAAADGHLDSVRILLDAGADVHGDGDLHDGGVIGWASRPGNEAVVDLLLARGARHHIFSAMATRDVDLVSRLVDADRDVLRRRRSRFENRQTPLHAAFAPPDGIGFLAGAPDYPMLQRLIELGADLEAEDERGRTALDVAALRGDREAARLLRAAGARDRERAPQADDGFQRRIAAAAASVNSASPMFVVRDMRATIRWYQSVGFTVADRYEDNGELVFARLTFGAGELTLSPGGDPGPRGVKLWFLTSQIDDLYALLKARQLRPGAGSADATGDFGVRFSEDLYEPFYGGRQFSIQDLNGVELIFWQPGWLAGSAPSGA
jgi:ankyrin repeat protein